MTYPIGVWGSYGNSQHLSAATAANLGLVGVGIESDWADIEVTQGSPDFSSLDAKIDEAYAAGFQSVTIAIGDSPWNSPQWLIDACTPSESIVLIDSAESHSTFCTEIVTPLYWATTFHQARLSLISAMGAHYSGDSRVVAVNQCCFVNHHSQDWNVAFFVGDIPDCEIGENQNQPQQWIDAGWSEATMLQVGKEICDACGTAFPTQNLKLPIGGISDSGMAANYSSLARSIETYVYGDGNLVPARPYASRFYMQRNTLGANWQAGSHWDNNPPGFGADNYIKYMIRNHHPQSGLQSVTDATYHADRLCGTCNCPGFDPACVMQAALDVAVSFGVTFYEIFAGDAANPDFYTMVRAATIAMGGTPRDASTPATTTASSAGSTGGAWTAISMGGFYRIETPGGTFNTKQIDMVTRAARLSGATITWL